MLDHINLSALLAQLEQGAQISFEDWEKLLEATPLLNNMAKWTGEPCEPGVAFQFYFPVNVDDILEDVRGRDHMQGSLFLYTNGTGKAAIWGAQHHGLEDQTLAKGSWTEVYTAVLRHLQEHSIFPSPKEAREALEGFENEVDIWTFDGSQNL